MSIFDLDQADLDYLGKKHQELKNQKRKADAMKESHPNIPEGFDLIEATDGNDDGNVFLLFDDFVENGPFYQTRALTPYEAGELAFALWNSATRAIALSHQVKLENEDA